MKKYIIISISLITLTIICFLFYRWFISNKKVSKVIVKELKTIQISSTTSKIVVPIASLPKETKKEKYDEIEGEITLSPHNPEDPNSLKMTVLLDKKNNEIITLTNTAYVNTLRKFYLNKDVKLKGRWRKDSVIYGRRYKCFWVEDFEIK